MEARVTMRGFVDGNGDYYEEVTAIQGYCDWLKVGDIRLRSTKQEIEDADKRFKEVFDNARAMLAEWKMADAQRDFDKRIRQAEQETWIAEKEAEQLRYEYEYEAALAAQKGRDD